MEESYKERYLQIKEKYMTVKERVKQMEEEKQKKLEEKVGEIINVYKSKETASTIDAKCKICENETRSNIKCESCNEILCPLCLAKSKKCKDCKSKVYCTKTCGLKHIKKCIQIRANKL